MRAARDGDRRNSLPFRSVHRSPASARANVELADALPPLRPEGADAEGTLPLVDVIRARVGSAHDLPLDSAYLEVSRRHQQGLLSVRRAARALCRFLSRVQSAFSGPARASTSRLLLCSREAERRPARLGRIFNGGRWIGWALARIPDDTQGFTLAAKNSVGRRRPPFRSSCPRTGKSSVNGDRTVAALSARVGQLRTAAGDLGRDGSHRFRRSAETADAAATTALSRGPSTW